MAGRSTRVVERHRMHTPAPRDRHVPGLVLRACLRVYAAVSSDGPAFHALWPASAVYESYLCKGALRIYPLRNHTAIRTMTGTDMPGSSWRTCSVVAVFGGPGCPEQKPAGCATVVDQGDPHRSRGQ